jgi:hypothetical protein
MPCYAKDLIKITKSQVGYLEKMSNKSLDHFTMNAGDKNYTKYARDFLKYAGVNYQGQPWCDMFVDDCFVKAFGVEKAKELLGGFCAYTPKSAQYFKERKQWFSKPEVGDIIFFKNETRINHTGIVVKVTPVRVYTIEGNTSNGAEVIENGGAVCEKNYLLTNTRIAGYGRPDYDVEVIKPKTKERVYIVRRGDSLSAISLSKLKNASRYHEIMELNNLKTTEIFVGQVLKLPSK